MHKNIVIVLALFFGSLIFLFTLATSIWSAKNKSKGTEKLYSNFSAMVISVSMGTKYFSTVLNSSLCSANNSILKYKVNIITEPEIYTESNLCDYQEKYWCCNNQTCEQIVIPSSVYDNVYDTEYCYPLTIMSRDRNPFNVGDILTVWFY
jgi:hypothetical protein